jgi:hypothetical protein
MSALRKAFAYHLERAEIASFYERNPQTILDVVVRKYRGDRASTSVVGGAVSRAIYDRWQRDGVRWRVVAQFRKGERIL